MRLMASVFALLLLAETSSAQDSLRAREWVNALCSESMAGRGYLNNGMGKAADFIANQFALIGLKPLFEDSKSGFKQEFQFKVNTFPKAPKLEINGIALTPGKEFIVNPESPSGKGNLGSTEAQKLLQWKSKLTWSVEREQASIPGFSVLRNAADSANLQSIHYLVKSKLINFTAYNVAGVIKGKKPEKWLLVSAHYDHLGGMGDGVWFPGANDNASGVAVLLDLARHFSQPANQNYFIK
jgi:hypothetical protein